MEKQAKVERKFFKISQIFFMIVTSLSLVAAIGGLLYGLSLQNATVSEKISQPSPTYEQIKRDKAAAKAEIERLKAQKEKAPQPTERVAPANPDAIPAEYLDVLNSIEKSLVSFTSRTGQVNPSEKLRFRIYKEAEGYKNYISVTGLLRQLDTEAKALDADYERIKLMPMDSPEYITWGSFLSEFFAQVNKSIRQQQQLISAEKIEVASKKFMASWVLYGAAGAFGVFIFFTMFLVLLSMEKNTYVLRQIQEELNKQKA